MLSGVEWMDGVDTPQTVMTTRAPAVLKIEKRVKYFQADSVLFLTQVTVFVCAYSIMYAGLFLAERLYFDPGKVIFEFDLVQKIDRNQHNHTNT